MNKIKFTRGQREKLTKNGWSKRTDGNVVESGNGLYTKQIGKVWITLMIRDHYIERFQSSVVMQTDDLNFAFDIADDFKEAIKEVRRLNYFNY